MPTKEEMSLSAIHGRCAAIDQRVDEAVKDIEIQDNDIDELTEIQQKTRRFVLDLQEDLLNQRATINQAVNQMTFNYTATNTDTVNLKREVRALWVLCLLSWGITIGMLLRMVHG